MLDGLLQPWYDAVEDPVRAQDQVLHRLLRSYAQTEYRAGHGAAQIETTRDYRQSFPVATYEDYQPMIKRMIAGELGLLLSEEPVGWAITRGTTEGESKFIPMTPTDLRMRISAGRAVMNHSVPAQEEIDALGGGKTARDWEARFELAYEKCRDENVTLVGGVAPTALRFARYLRRTHGVCPKDLWQTQVMTLGSVPDINTRYQPTLRALYGPAAIREIYGATEGMFGQQRDERRGWVPNYDLFFLEVKTRSGIKMVREMRPGEMGSLIASTPILPRYGIGDRILALRPPYFRCIGRDQWWTPLRYAWDELMTLSLGRL